MADLSPHALRVAFSMVVGFVEAAWETVSAPALGVPQHERLDVAMKALLGGAVSLAVNHGGLTPAEAADRLEAFARKVRSGEAEATGQAIVRDLLGRGGPKS